MKSYIKPTLKFYKNHVFYIGSIFLIIKKKTRNWIIYKLLLKNIIKNTKTWQPNWKFIKPLHFKCTNFNTSNYSKFSQATFNMEIAWRLMESWKVLISPLRQWPMIHRHSTYPRSCISIMDISNDRSVEG